MLTTTGAPVHAAEIEDVVGREALAKFLDGDEEGARDLLAVAHDMASPTSPPCPSP